MSNAASALGVQSNDPLAALLTILAVGSFAWMFLLGAYYQVFKRERWTSIPPAYAWKAWVACGFVNMRIAYGFISDAGKWLPGDARNDGPLIALSYILLLVVGPLIVGRGLWLGWRLHDRRVN
jgi:hypothetical protein